MELFVWVQGFRQVVTGPVLVGLAAAWKWHMLWLLIVSLTIGGEELLESSVVISALQRERRSP